MNTTEKIFRSPFVANKHSSLFSLCALHFVGYCFFFYSFIQLPIGNERAARWLLLCIGCFTATKQCTDFTLCALLSRMMFIYLVSDVLSIVLKKIICKYLAVKLLVSVKMNLSTASLIFWWCQRLRHHPPFFTVFAPFSQAFFSFYSSFLSIFHWELLLSSLHSGRFSEIKIFDSRKILIEISFLVMGLIAIVLNM